VPENVHDVASARKDGTPPTIDVCVASYKRPELLAKLLQALLAQETGGELRFRIIVADNDAEGSAEPVVRSFRGRGVELLYGVEPEQSVSLARNKSLSLATAELIATTDDDLLPDRRWLVTLHRALRAYGADVVHGPVLAEFLPGTPAHIRECPVFNRPDPPTGSTSDYVFTTASSLFRRALVAHLEAPFDPRFGRTSGEDSAFFNALEKREARMIWCHEARVIGPVPAARANLRWLIKRRFRYGNTQPTNGAKPIAVGEVRAAGGDVVKLLFAAPCLLLAGLVVRRHHDEGMKGLQRIRLYVAFLLGVVAHHASFRYEEYRPR
jgi:succinoglycan biosynthesis protein ExoM